MEIGDIVHIGGVLGVVLNLDVDDDGQIMGFTLRSDDTDHHFNIDMVLDDADRSMLN